MSKGGVVTRFAPSPTGHLHLGHAASALVAHRLARSTGGRLLLRIEDIDTTRCREEFVRAIIEDLSWLAIDWDGPVRRQSEHLSDYDDALGQLENLRVLYPCFCTRREIQEQIASIASAPHGPDGFLYPGTCRGMKPDERERRTAAGEPFALRLDVGAAWRLVGESLTWIDQLEGIVRATPGDLGDVVLARKDVGTSYHLAVTLDDALQGINLVVRGQDLFHATHIHRLLQALLGFHTPAYLHHPMLTDRDGRRLSKRDGAVTLRALRESGVPADEVRARAAL